MPSKQVSADTHPLAPDRAFVVQLARQQTDQPETMSGRVEHIASGRAMFFASLVELSRFLGAQERPDASPPRD